MANTVNVLTNVPAIGTSRPPLIIDGNYLAAGTARTLTYADNRAVVLLDTLTGSTVTLPAATGSGVKYRFYVSVIATSNSHIVKVASATDYFQGVLYSTLVGTPTTNNGWLPVTTGAVSGRGDTITLNRGTTGSASIGEWFEVEDFASAVWQVIGNTTQTGAAATPFSATV